MRRRVRPRVRVSGPWALAWTAVTVGALVSCDGSPPGDATEEGDPSVSETGTAAGDRPASPEADADRGGLADAASTPPDSVLVRPGACPFECCMYGAWVARERLAVMVGERSADTAFVLQPGDSVTAEGGHVYVTGDQRVVVVDDPTSFYGADAFAPGDTLFVLDHLGEGTFNVWFDGSVRQTEFFWVERNAWEEGGRWPAYSIGTYGSEWWVRLTSDEGGEGWLPLPTRGIPFDGADGCGFE